MKITIEAKPEEIKETLQAISSNKEYGTKIVTILDGHQLSEDSF